MARDVLAVTPITIDAATAAATPETITAANGLIIETGITDNLVISVTHTAASKKTMTIVAGGGPRAALGDLEVDFAAGHETAVVKFFALESARFVQNDGTILIDFESGFTGSAVAYRLPKGL